MIPRTLAPYSARIRRVKSQVLVFADSDSAKIRTCTIRREIPAALALASGSGVDPASIRVTVDGRPHTAVYDRGIVSVDRSVTAGSHTVTLRVSDYQESKNMEDVGPILPNTRTLRTTVTVR